VLDVSGGLYFCFYGGAHTEETGFKQLTLCKVKLQLQEIRYLIRGFKKGHYALRVPTNYGFIRLRNLDFTQIVKTVYSNFSLL
jgi:hypothetical protein